MPPLNPLNSNELVLERERETTMSTSFRLLTDETHSTERESEGKFFPRLYERILMTVQKANSPSISISPAVIGLALSLMIQTGLGIWWAAGIANDNDKNKEEIRSLKSIVEGQKVYIDNTREKFIKMEALIETIQKREQLDSLLTERERKER